MKKWKINKQIKILYAYSSSELNVGALADVWLGDDAPSVTSPEDSCSVTFDVELNVGSSSEDIVAACVSEGSSKVANNYSVFN